MLATTVSENEKMSIEAAIKIFDPRTATLGPRGGRATLHWDDIAAMLAAIERENPVGYQLIMVNYRGDRQQEAALRENVGTWAANFCQKSHIADHALAAKAAETALDILFHRPLKPQMRSLQHLHRLYGPYAQREAQRIKSLKKTLTKTKLKPETAFMQARIEFLEEHISAARTGIDRWVIAHAAASTQCPRCRGAGQIVKPHPGVCPICNGHQYLEPTRREILRHISKCASRAEGYLFILDECRWWLASHSNAATTRLHELFDLNQDG